ncbi:MAG: hypothetical protein J5845_08030 [Lachnospiraceae bacterium]|nr:hypothetical protein [Lachnospiraceae bacterium]
MKDNTEAIKKEIKGRATALLVAVALFDAVQIIMLAALWDNQTARTVLLILTGLFTALLIVSIAAVCNPLKFKWMFRNLRAEQKAQPKPRAKKVEYKHDKDFGFVSTVFNRPVSVSALNVSEDYVKKCIEVFQNMSEGQIDQLTDDAAAYYREILECSGDTVPNMPENLNGREILDWIYPKVMWIGNDEGRVGPAEFLVECDCEWEKEHGMEIVVCGGEIIHVGAYDGDLDYWKEEKHGHDNSL